MAVGDLRIGIVGAGRVAHERHLPGFAAIDGVEVVGVCDRRRESSGRVARAWNIPKIYAAWEHLVDDEAIDAVVVATWPYLHCPITLAALDAGKHVLVQSRMAMNAREAQRMLDRARECPHLVAMVAPTALGLVGDRYVRRLLDDGRIGALRELHVHGVSDRWADPRTPLQWQQVSRYSGFNMLDLGALHEVALRWASPPVQVFARAVTHIDERSAGEGTDPAPVGVPDSVQALTTHKDGSIGLYRLTAVAWHRNATAVELFGDRGTLTYDLARDVVRFAPAGKALRSVPIPDAQRGGWRAEAEFVAAIRGEAPVSRNDFLTAARAMHFTEAVARSSLGQEPIDLPLRDFSSPDA